jgi:DNA invertase Pin-like site-specific DNA recombinase
MIAAIYARKSTEQNSIADDQKSVSRQVEHARAYATAKGWTSARCAPTLDDGISGAEFANRPGFLRLMNVLKPRAPFQALIMSEVSRLGREQIETAYALKQLSVAGVRCFSYLEDRELLLESATDKFLLGAVTFAADLEREKARQRTYDAMLRKAKAGDPSEAAPSATTTCAWTREASAESSTTPRPPLCGGSSRWLPPDPGSPRSRRCSTKNTPRRRGHSKGGLPAGRRRRSVRSSIGPSITARSSGTKAANVTVGA